MSNKIVSDFLGGVVIPDDVDFECCYLIKIGSDSLSHYVKESFPQLYIERGIFDETNQRAVSVFDVTKDHCDGHFIECPMLPMAKLGQVMAQVGSILVIKDKEDSNGGKECVALATGVGGITSMNANGKQLIVPGDQLLIIAEKDEKLVRVKISVYVNGYQISEMFLRYMVVKWDHFKIMYKMQTTL